MWLVELRNNRRSFAPFNHETTKLSEALCDIAPRKKLFQGTIDYKTLLSALNKASMDISKTGRYTSANVSYKLLDLLDEVLEKLIDEKFVGVV